MNKKMKATMIAGAIISMFGLVMVALADSPCLNSNCNGQNVQGTPCCCGSVSSPQPEGCTQNCLCHCAETDNPPYCDCSGTCD